VSKEDRRGGGEVLAFVLLAYFFTWAFRAPLAASAAGLISVQVPRYFQFLGDFGPLLAAILLTFLCGRRRGVTALLRPLVQWREPAKLYFIALIGPVLLFAASAVLAHLIFGERLPSLAHLGRWEELPSLSPLLTWSFLLLVIGVGEEVGWRGYMQPRLQERHGQLAASVIVGLAWVFWHLPSFVFDEAFRAMLPWRAVGWALLLVLGSIFLGWLYNAGRRSLLLPVLFHGTQDFTMGSLAARGEALQLVWALLFVLLLAGILVVSARQFPSDERT
jgi:membrane protease YdiL (CAAX protease family)